MIRESYIATRNVSANLIVFIPWYGFRDSKNVFKSYEVKER